MGSIIQNNGVSNQKQVQDVIVLYTEWVVLGQGFSERKWTPQSTKELSLSTILNIKEKGG